MGWFDGVSEVGSSRSDRHHRSSSRHRSTAGSIFGGGDNKHNSSRSSFFGFNNKSSSSYYKRSPRQGYVKRVYSQLRRLLRDLLYYLKKHPMKVFMLVIMPLITGGALTGLLAKFGIRLPGGLEKLFKAGGGGGGSAFGGGSSFGGAGIGRGVDGGLQWERSRGESGFDGMGALGAAVGSLGGLGGAVSLAKMFM